MEPSARAEEELESKVEELEKELLVVKLALKKSKGKRVKLEPLVRNISKKARAVDSTRLIREMRERSYE